MNQLDLVKLLHADGDVLLNLGKGKRLGRSGAKGNIPAVVTRSTDASTEDLGWEWEIIKTTSTKFH